MAKIILLWPHGKWNTSNHFEIRSTPGAPICPTWSNLQTCWYHRCNALVFRFTAMLLSLCLPACFLPLTVTHQQERFLDCRLLYYFWLSGSIAGITRSRSQNYAVRAALKQKSDVNQRDAPITTYGPHYKSSRNWRRCNVTFNGNVLRADKTFDYKDWHDRENLGKHPHIKPAVQLSALLRIPFPIPPHGIILFAAANNLSSSERSQ